MFLVKNSTALRSQHLFNGAKELIRAQFSAITLVNQRQRHTDADEDAEQGPTRKCQSKKKAEEAKKCVKFVPSNALKAECVPINNIVPKYYKQLNPCKTDKELAVQHPKYLGVYGRCDIPYLPEPHCQDPCDLVERLDDKYYKPSKSLDRDFDQYWVECFFRKQKRCCKKVPPERTQRVIYNKCAAVPKRKQCFMVNPMPCKQEAKEGPCPKFSLCGCPPPAAKTNCKVTARRKRCRRRSCQYPSFSECQHEELNVGRPVECRCLEVPPMCLVYRRGLLNIRLPCQRPESRDPCES
ncbi:uncharacterized protein LOC108149707 [Drosophila elegans]|uniref:uncharacterized protein LOC108149707 n=1 Tax=Drosophila elegans TaxID=30023 RepID=UPI0007E7C446|nr:uncharacterized protein LOC108149707 [Drosophila elegans]